MRDFRGHLRVVGERDHHGLVVRLRLGDEFHKKSRQPKEKGRLAHPGRIDDRGYFAACPMETVATASEPRPDRALHLFAARQRRVVLCEVIVRLSRFVPNEWHLVVVECCIGVRPASEGIVAKQREQLQREQLQLSCLKLRGFKAFQVGDGPAQVQGGVWL